MVPRRPRKALLHRWHQLSADERGALWPALWRLLVIRMLLLFGIRATARWTAGRPDEHLAVSLELWQRRAQGLKRVGERLPTIHCLARALALRWWMRQQRLEATVVIGVRASRPVDSHAWVEIDGQAFDERPDAVRGYTPVKRY